MAGQTFDFSNEQGGETFEQLTEQQRDTTLDFISNCFRMRNKRSLSERPAVVARVGAILRGRVDDLFGE